MSAGHVVQLLITNYFLSAMAALRYQLAVSFGSNLIAPRPIFGRLIDRVLEVLRDFESLVEDDKLKINKKAYL